MELSKETKENLWKLLEKLWELMDEYPITRAVGVAGIIIVSCLIAYFCRKESSPSPENRRRSNDSSLDAPSEVPNGREDLPNKNRWKPMEMKEL